MSCRFNFVLVELTPEQKMLKYVDAGIRRVERGAAWGNALTAMSGNMQRQQNTTTSNSSGTITTVGTHGTTTRGTYGGTTTSSASAPDYAAQARAAETIRERSEATASLASFISRVALRANTLPPTQNIRGYVAFERDKKARLVMLSGLIGDTIYQFPFDLTGQ